MLPYARQQVTREEPIVIWLIVAVMAVVVGGAALVALGAGGSLPEAAADRLAVRLPRERPLARADLDAVRLPMALRGYRMDEVDDLLDRLGAELSHRDGRIAELEAAAAPRGEHGLTLHKASPDADAAGDAAGGAAAPGAAGQETP